jgi:hypothetical protein
MPESLNFRTCCRQIKFGSCEARRPLTAVPPFSLGESLFPQRRGGVKGRRLRPDGPGKCAGQTPGGSSSTSILVAVSSSCPATTFTVPVAFTRLGSRHSLPARSRLTSLSVNS